jgi:hypothetical protein
MKIMKKKKTQPRRNTRETSTKRNSRSGCEEKKIRTIQVIKCLHGIHRSDTLCVATKRKYLERQNGDKKEIRKLPVR